jgi:hypothetical protein
MNRVIACASEKFAWRHCDTAARQSKSSGHQRGHEGQFAAAWLKRCCLSNVGFVPVIAVSLPLAENFGSARNKKGLTEARAPLILPVGVNANRNLSI